MPQYIVSQNKKKVILRNFEGVITTYTEPEYIEEPCNCPVCRKEREDKLSGVAGLLQGNAMNLEPTEMLRKERAKKRKQ